MGGFLAQAGYGSQGLAMMTLPRTRRARVVLTFLSLVLVALAFRAMVGMERMSEASDKGTGQGDFGPPPLMVPDGASWEVGLRRALPSPIEPDARPGPALTVPSDFVTENVGQLANREVRYYGAVGGLHVGFAQGAVLLDLREVVRETVAEFPGGGDSPDAPVSVRGHMIRVTFDRANSVLPRAREELRHRNNYFLGSDPAQWRTEVRNYRQVIYENLYDGIDVIYRLDEHGLKYDIFVDRGADLSTVALTYHGADGLSVSPTGLAVHTSLGGLRDDLPLAYREGGETLSCSLRSAGEVTVGYSCPEWEGKDRLVIDPLVYSTFLGGSKSEESLGIALDASGNAYITGQSWDDVIDFPTTVGAYDTTQNGNLDAFVTKLNASGSDLVYSTFLGGSGNDTGHDIALDSLGNAYVTGETEDAASDFPTTVGAYDTTQNGFSDVFVTKLNASGSGLVYSTYLGGGGEDYGYRITLGISGNAYVTGGGTNDFPTTNGSYDTTQNGFSDVFVAELNARGSGLVYSTYLGGTGNEYGWGIALDIMGNAFLTGYTYSANFPTTVGAYDLSHNGGGEDAFVAELNAAGSVLVYSTFLGGSGLDQGLDLALDSSGNAYVAGGTFSVNFPATGGAYNVTYGGNSDAFVVKLNAAGNGLVYSTFLGGSWFDRGWGIALDASGSAHLIGEAGSTEFPTTGGAHDTTQNGDQDVFVTKLNAAGNGLVYSTFLGGSADDRGFGVALDRSENCYLTGGTASADFPMVIGSFDTTRNLPFDAFVSKLNLTGIAPVALPPRNLTTKWDAGSVRVSWEPPPSLPDEILIYRADSPLFTDLSDTSSDLAARLAGTATSWDDPVPLAVPGEAYYIARAAYGADLSPTTNTAGVFADTLRDGLTAISRPLEYFPWVDYAAPGQDDTIAEYTAAFGASWIQYLDTAGTWRAGSGQRLALSDAYLVTRTLSGTFAFTGLPGSHIRYDEGPPSGFTLAEARSLTATVSGNDITLSWTTPAAIASLASLEVWHGTTRTGIFDGTAAPPASLPPATTTFTHSSALLGGDEHYYWIVPRDLSGELAASTYSIGVWAKTFRTHDTLALPLRPDVPRAVSWYADVIPGALGVLWLTTDGAWGPHFTAMAAGTYDAPEIMGSGVQISIRSTAPVRYAFVGG